MLFEKNETTNLNKTSMIANSLQVIKTLEYFLLMAEKTEKIIDTIMNAYDIEPSDIAAIEKNGDIYFYLENNKHLCFDLVNRVFRFINPEDNKILSRLPKINGKEKKEITNYSSNVISELFLACAGIDIFLYEIINKIYQVKKGLVGEFHHHVEFAKQCIFEEKL